MYYDINYVRKLKLAKLDYKEIIPPKTITGECLFEQDWKNKKLWCKYTNIWKYLENNYSNNYDDVQQFIMDRLEEQDKMMTLTPFSQMMTLTPLSGIGFTPLFFSSSFFSLDSEMLEEQNKMNILTSHKINIS